MLDADLNCVGGEVLRPLERVPCQVQNITSLSLTKT